MKVIDYDPAKIIPNISEDDINNKIIISYKKNFEYNRNVFNYIIKIEKINEPNIYRFRGSAKNENSDWNDIIVVWYDTYNIGNSIMDLLLKEYKYMTKFGWLGNYWVIESFDELIKMMYSVGLNTSLKYELIKYWNSLPGNQRL